MMASLADSELKQIVDLYCAHLASKGLALRADDVLFALRATQIFHALIRGGGRSAQSRGDSERLFRWGMDHTSNISPPEIQAELPAYPLRRPFDRLAITRDRPSFRGSGRGREGGSGCAWRAQRLDDRRAL